MRVDILLLDIQMPEITGLEFARSLKNPPAVIFTTAYSEYAVESYELDVVDYLLKPIAFPRFLQAINKVIERKGNYTPNTTPRIEQVTLPAEKVEEESIIIKSGYKLYKINYSDLLYIEGQREYVTFHTTKQRITTLYSLKNLEEELPSSHFKRIHKSYIVSIKNIELIDKNILHIADKKLPIGNSYKDELMKIFET
ncbi:MAG: LytTR family DNA-binding domain-containing protein [Prevotella sp.]|jgi:DNA-binding LytR/AlgR family response regulator|nr:LytTR family DNA-binding domain-containing protein [Prevotella sp.]